MKTENPHREIKIKFVLTQRNDDKRFILRYKKWS